ncbi:MAG: MATE family efflux transporter [Candidatus Muirbacterium halophilum]|nr:MATE family efflux transporter [Candidatus Muirbacterium halophilum]MCK9476068.1 MATE family efflux transporter [Candidatus Muirbacterium halophilum]
MKIDLNENPIKIFISNVFPGIFSMVILSLYILCDTAFIGRGIGENGLAALNICLPVFSFIFGIGVLLGAGGSILFAIRLHSTKTKQAYQYFYITLITGIIISIFISITALIFKKNIINALGATPELITLCNEYLQNIIPFAFFFISNSILGPFLRNMNSPKLVMISMCLGGILNIALDYYYIFIAQKGMGGAAFATGLSTVLSFVIMSFYMYFFRRIPIKYIKIENPLKKIKKIISIGFPSFIVELSNGIVIFLFNFQLLKIGGNLAVSAYGIIANISLMCSAIFSGIVTGIQPILSAFWGANRKKETLYFLKLSIFLSVIIGFSFYITGLTNYKFLINIFTKSSTKLYDIAANGIKIYFAAFILTGINLNISIFYQATERSSFSNKINFSKCILFVIIFILTLPYFFGINGVWTTMIATEISTLILILILKDKNKTKYN